MKYDIPETIEALFNNGNCFYSIVDYDINPMDNIASMKLFLDEIGIKEENIAEYDGTQVYLKHDAFPFQIRVDSGGLGDFYSHSFNATVI